MSLGNNPSIVTNGLIFYYDMNNPSSYRSPPLRNVLTEILPRGQGSSSTYQFSNGTENVYIPNLGFIPNCAYMDMYNDYNGGSNNCCPSPFSYGQGLSVSGSTEYTYAIVYKSVNGYTNANYMYHYEYNGGSYITEYGLFYSNGTYSGQVRHLGDDWYWASSKFTTNASCNLFYTGAWMYEYARYNRLYVAKAMIVQGDYTNLHPKFWPALNTTVSNTQAIVDLTNQHTIYPTNLTTTSYTANRNSIRLNSSSTNQYIYTDGTNYWNAWSPDGSVGNSNLTLEIIFKTNSETDDGFIISRPWNGSGQYNYYVTAGSFQLYIGSNSASMGFDGVYDGNIQHMVYWMNSTQFGVYKNGKVYVSGTAHNLTGGGASAGNNQFGTLVGSLYPYGEGWGGNSGFSVSADVYLFRIYNRALSASEVEQNFVTQRGIYGI